MEHSQKFSVYTPTPRVLKVHVLLHPESDTEDPNRYPWLDVAVDEASPDDRHVVSADVLVEYANCRADLAGVRRFTERFGPVSHSRHNMRSFGFPLKDWIDEQSQFRKGWDFLLEFGARAAMPELFPGYKFRIAASGFFQLTRSGLVYDTESLHEAMMLKLLQLCERKRLRRCHNPACTQTPYFVAEHARQTYCSTVCSDWGQSKAKKKWWGKKGPGWRRKQSAKAGKKRKSTRGAKHGAK
jgi:hypothetical protein